jgi:hypothetical protein
VLVELRAVPDCPNVDATRELLHACLAEAGLQVTVIERVGDYPSPSVLIDGRDVTGADPNGPAACLLRPPTADQIRAALDAAGTDSPDDPGSVGADRSASGADHAGAECCPPGGAVRTDRPQRAAGLPFEVRAVHRGVLSHFAATGAAPTLAELAQVAADAGVDPQAALRRLAEDDLLAVDEAGRLVAAYPFSPTPTRHRVEVDGVQLYAMCAIDALGIPAMLDRDATITSTDPQTGRPITVTVTARAVVFDPPETVLVYAATGRGGRSVDTCCSTINFFADAVSARTWIGAHPHLTADVLDQERAVALGRGIFGPLLRP